MLNKIALLFILFSFSTNVMCGGKNSKLKSNTSDVLDLNTKSRGRKKDNIQQFIDGLRDTFIKDLNLMTLDQQIQRVKELQYLITGYILDSDPNKSADQRTERKTQLKKILSLEYLIPDENLVIEKTSKLLDKSEIPHLNYGLLRDGLSKEFADILLQLKMQKEKENLDEGRELQRALSKRQEKTTMKKRNSLAMRVIKDLHSANNSKSMNQST